MARLFISCNHKNFELGKALQAELVERGHEITLPVDARPAGRWENQLLRALHRADAFIGVLTPEGQGSHWVVGQTGMAISCEAIKNTLVLPVCLKDQIPHFVAAFHCFWLTDDHGQRNKNLAAELHEAIEAHAAARTPRIFICHRHASGAVAKALIELLKSAFDIKDRDIRCTSVPGYRLPVGAKSADTLQADLAGAEVVAGLITPQTTESDYVLFELGASWGLQTPTFPLRISGAGYQHVPEVLREKSSLALEDVSQCLQLVEDISRVCSIPRKQTDTDDLASGVRRKAEELARASKAAPPP